MSGTHVLEHPGYTHDLGDVAKRTINGCRALGRSGLNGVSRGIYGFEKYMAARSLPEGFERDAGLTALKNVDSAFARDLEEKFNPS